MTTTANIPCESTLIESSYTLIPCEPEFTGLQEYREPQERLFREQRKNILDEFHVMTDLPGLLQDLRPDTLYRLVLPEGKILQQGADGLFTGVLRESNGKIAKHAKFAQVGPNVMRMATALGSQVLLISIAMQLNRIESALSKLSDELHRNRLAKVLSGIRQYRYAMEMRKEEERRSLLHHAAQTLIEGVDGLIMDLAPQINALPTAENGRWDNWGRCKAEKARPLLQKAEETFMMAKRGTVVLALCYAALGEKKAGMDALQDYLDRIASCGVEKAAKGARIVPVKDNAVPPERQWLQFLEEKSAFEAKETIAKTDRIAILFRKDELTESA
jgi:hypothetical protein